MKGGVGYARASQQKDEDTAVGGRGAAGKAAVARGLLLFPLSDLKTKILNSLEEQGSRTEPYSQTLPGTEAAA